jgi:hypothetical protein
MNMTFSLLLKGLECYHHDLCLDKCPDLTKVFVKCEHEENECWVNMKEIFYCKTNSFLESNYSIWHKTWLWYVFNISKNE